MNRRNFVKTLFGLAAAISFSAQAQIFGQTSTQFAPDGTAANPSYTFSSDVDTGIYRENTNSLGIAAGGNGILQIGTTAVRAGTSVVFQTADGSVGTPGYAFTNDPDTGMYRIGANNIGIGVAGAKVLDVSSAGLGVTGLITQSGAGTNTFSSSSGLAMQITQTASGSNGLYINPTHASYAGTTLLVDVGRDNTTAYDLANFRTNANSSPKTVFKIIGSGYVKASNTGTFIGSTSAYHEFTSSADSEYIGRFKSSHATNGYGITVVYTSDPNGTGNPFIDLYGDIDGTPDSRGAWRSNGGIANYSANNVNLSSEKVKYIYGMSPDYSSFVKALQFKNWKYLDSTEENQHIDGPTAEQVESLDPSLVTVWDIKKGTKGIYTYRLQQRINSVIPRLLVRADNFEEENQLLKVRLQTIEKENQLLKAKFEQLNSRIELIEAANDQSFKRVAGGN